MQETRVQSLGREDTLEKGMEAHSNILAWRIPWKLLAGYSSLGYKEAGMIQWLPHHTTFILHMVMYIFLHYCLNLSYAFFPLLCLHVCFVFLHLRCYFAKSLQLCLTWCDPMYYSLPGYAVHVILQARILSGLPCPPPWDIFLTHGSNPHLLHLLYWQTGSLLLVPPGHLHCCPANMFISTNFLDSMYMC